MKSKYIYLVLIFVALSFSACRKLEEKKDTKVEGKIIFENGSAAGNVYVNIIQHIKKTKEPSSSNSTFGNFLIKQIQADNFGNYKLTFRAEERPENYKGDYDDYYIYVTKTEIEKIEWEGNKLWASTTWNIETPDNGEIKMSHKNKIDIKIR